MIFEKKINTLEFITAFLHSCLCILELLKTICFVGTRVCQLTEI